MVFTIAFNFIDFYMPIKECNYKNNLIFVQLVKEINKQTNKRNRKKEVLKGLSCYQGYNQT